MDEPARKKRGPKPKGIDEKVNFRLAREDRLLIDVFALEDGLDSASDWLRNLVRREIQARRAIKARLRSQP